MKDLGKSAEDVVHRRAPERKAKEDFGESGGIVLTMKLDNGKIEPGISGAIAYLEKRGFL